MRPSSIMTSDVEAAAAASRNSAHDDDPDAEGVKGGVGTAMGVMIVFGLIVLASGWVFYAYRNPHTKSGQLLIQVRKDSKEGNLHDLNLNFICIQNAINRHGTDERSEKGI